ncbi:28S ribosomal protein S31, mitochondrial [Pseudolycoriella hygida]|uniref:Small ribosomal subunit protein mS31 n=1 Tax=Pseudolycoriella hygida TaxID=35572 RepID=A0A9Q0S9M8_9DIPT|nr:28S ribosomal protein S31, mitochondrial [Pseudolycoriella hygida]
MSLFRISRLQILRNGRQPAILSNYSDDSSKKDKPSEDTVPVVGKEKKAETVDNKKEVASKRLHELIAMMSNESDLSIVKEVIKPRSAAEKKERRKALSSKKEEEKESKTANIADAAKQVAETLGGDTKKTESELLSILLKTDINKGDHNLNSLLGDMVVDKNEGPHFERRSDIVKNNLGRRPIETNMKMQFKEGTQRPRSDRNEIRSKPSVRMNVDLFGGKPLGIFTNAGDLQDSPDTLSTWNHLQNKELKLAVTHPPRNYFEKMVLWTEQGKLWKFPIDNEQGMDDEAKIYFTEHVFLDKHLESWCPTKGPIRHFMELVCVGLSKNPYYTVAQKKEHIEWFRDYFAAKKELLDSVIIHSDAELQQ